MLTRLIRRLRLPRWPKRTVRLRLTGLYGGLFLVSGAALLTITYLLVAGVPGVRSMIPPTPITVVFPSARVPPSSDSGNIRDALVVLMARQRADELHTLLIRSGIALVGMAIVSIWLGWLVAGRLLRPLRTITTTTRHISEANLHERLALAGSRDELIELADTIDGLLGRLEGAFDAQRRFVANASHELRTPLAMMRTSLDVAEGKPAPLSADAAVLAWKIREGLDQADRLVEGFLTLARAQRGVFDDQATVALPALASRALADRMPAIAQRGLAVAVDLAQAPTTGSEILLTRMVANLIDNAVRHNEPDGRIEVRTGHADGTARLVVESSGPVLDEEQVRQLGEPFRRLGTERTGDSVGLGLSIVAATVTAHEGTLILQPREAGGLSVIVELPVAADGEHADGERAGKGQPAGKERADVTA